MHVCGAALGSGRVYFIAVILIFTKVLQQIHAQVKWVQKSYSDYA